MVLVVDDHDDIRAGLVLLLTKEGFDVTGVSSGLKALDFFETSIPQLVLLDFNMPDMNGLEVVDAMKSDLRLAVVPIIMFSGHGESIRKSALEKGVNSYVLKGSLDWSKLRREVSSFVTPRVPQVMPQSPPSRRIADAG